MVKIVKHRYELRTSVDRTIYKHISKQAASKKLSMTSYLRTKLHELIKEGKI